MKWFIVFVLIVFLSFLTNHFLHEYHGGSNNADLLKNLLDAKYLDSIKQHKLTNILSLFSKQPRFMRRAGLENINCKRIYDGDVEYTNQIPKEYRKLQTSPLNMSCEAIRNRVIGNYPNPNINYPIAIVRNVFMDYEFLELQLAVSYSNENQFCYTIDSKAPPEFRDRIKSLATCLPNVYINQEKRDINQFGHNANAAHMDCMEILLENGDWNYVILLANHDVILHTNSELAEIFGSLNGANLIKTAVMPEGRINNMYQWDVKNLEILTRDTPLTETEKQNAVIEFATGYLQSCVSRKAVDWMINRMNLMKMVDQFSDYNYFVDEQFLSTLQNSETLRMPGGYHSACLKKKKPVESITRFSKWDKEDMCNSKVYRQTLCVFGIEDLVMLESTVSPQYISVNKLMPEVDFAAISCIAERIFNRTHHRGVSLVDKEFFTELPLVKYQTLKLQPNFNLQEYKC